MAYNTNYHTIDPLILETLNLNQRRMNHIFDILHGRSPEKLNNQKINQINNNKNNHKFTSNQKYKTLDYGHINTNKQTQKYQYQYQFPQKVKQKQKLPSIKQIQNNRAFDERIKKRKDNPNQNDSFQNNNNNKNRGDLDYSIEPRRHNSQKAKLDKSKIQSNNLSGRKSVRMNNNNLEEQDNQFTLPKNKIIKNLNKSSSRRSVILDDQKQLNQFVRQIQSRKNGKNSLALARNRFKFAIGDVKSKSPDIKQNSSKNNLQELLYPTALYNPSNLRLKTKQLVADYVGENNIRKSKSMHVLNPKDIYRLQIEQVLQQLTPIQKLQQAEKRMKRIKRRYGNLKKFDDKYYSKLNQMDLLGL